MFDAFGNATSVPPAHWRDEPATRGSWNILSTCLITLGLCLWSAMHLNIPRHKEGVWRPKIRKAGWLLVGLVAPELLAYTAWYQRRAAHKLNAVMQLKLGQRRSLTHAQRLARFFIRCCRRHKQNANDETSDVEHNSLASNTANRRHIWTTTHSYYAIMGGFVFDISREEVNFLPNSRERLTLTLRGLMFLLEHEPDLIPNLSEEHIHDKSKTSNLAKTIVCLQALWFCVQCIVRFAQGLAVGLLELNVFGHAICALLMYILWWDKPMDIEEPTVIDGKMVREMCALMCMHSFPSATREGFSEIPFGVRYGSERRHNIAETSIVANGTEGNVKWYRMDYLFRQIKIRMKSKLFPDRYPPQLECCLQWVETDFADYPLEKFDQDTAFPVDLDYPIDALQQKDQAASSVIPSSTCCSSLPAQNGNVMSIQTLTLDRFINPDRISIDGLCLTLGRWPYTINPMLLKNRKFVSRRSQPDYTPVSITLSLADAVRWQLCARALQRFYPGSRQILGSATPRYRAFPAYRSVYERSPNWPSSEHLEIKELGEEQSYIIWLVFTFAGLVYGGLHLLAWDAPFPSYVEGILWRSSGVLLGSSGPICYLFYLTFQWITEWEDSWIRGTISWLCSKIHLKFWSGKILNAIVYSSISILSVVIFAFCISYLAARGYLVVESFKQLAHLPDSAFTLPGWSQYYPHIS